MRTDFERIARDANPDVVVIFAPTGQVLYWNSGAARTFGWSSDEAVGQSLRRLLVPEHQHDELRRIQGVAMRQGSLLFEAEWRRRDGTSVRLDSSLVAIGDVPRQVDCLLLAQKDVTELLLSRDATAAAVSYGELLEAMPDGMVLVNASGRIMFVNAQLERMFGYEHGELLGKGFELLLPERQRAGHVRRREEYFAHPHLRTGGVELDLYGLRKNGSEFPLDISLNPLRTVDGVLAIGAIRDVTERKRIELVLASKNLALEKASSARDYFLSAMSHELRTPLNAIIGFAGILEMQMPGPLNEAQRNHVATIKSSAHDLLQMINGVLDVAERNSGAATGVARRADESAD